VLFSSGYATVDGASVFQLGRLGYLGGHRRTMF